MLIGYGIVTQGQYRDTLSQLYEVGCKQVFTDEQNAKNNARAGFEQALSYLNNPNDILVITEINHLGRSAESIIKNLGILVDKEVNLQILGDNLLLPLKESTHVKLIKILVDFQYQKIATQTQVRKQSLQKNGQKPGRKPVIDDKKAKKVQTLLQKGYKIKEICQSTQISESSFHKYFPASERQKNLAEKKLL